jgi:signal transduction histidine kinase
VIVSIADNGCGIAPENVEKIFDLFFTTKPVGVGTGQGLAIARSIVVEKHGGALDVQSELGSGTRFTIRLPVSGRTPTEAA